MRQKTLNLLEHLRLRLARGEALWLLALLGALSGLMAGLAIVVFRLLMAAALPMLLGADHPQQFEFLDPWLRFLLPTLGGLLVGLWLSWIAAADRELGVVHVLERLAYNEGQLPLKNAGVQFGAALLCILAGHSVGREGPSIHIGAAAGSVMGQRLHLPNNSIRVLVGCGGAGAIAAAFNTPLAGVIFAMEVVLVEYTLTGFIPIILAAVSATALSRAVFGDAPVFSVPGDLDLGALSDLPGIVLLGVILGGLAAGFTRLLLAVTRQAHRYRLWLRLLLAGVVTGLIGLVVPEALGIGYDTLNAALLEPLGWEWLLWVLVGKLAATVLGLGLGLPGGLIGPLLVIGALAGAALGYLLPGTTTPAFYAMLGMGALMGATLNAPLAALTALLELTANPHVILPGMLAIVAACMTAQQALHTPSVFVALMRARGLEYTVHPVSQFLRRLGVVHKLDRQVTEWPRQVVPERLARLPETPASWIVVRTDDGAAQVLMAVDLLACHDSAVTAEGTVDLLALPVRKLKALPLSSQATLWGALQRMDREGVDALYVLSARRGHVLGVITREVIERSYRLGGDRNLLP